MTSAAARWDHRWAQATDAPGPPHPLVPRLAARLPAGARVLDVAAGRGRQARALHAHGLDVWAVDASAVGLAQLSRVAPAVHTVCTDLTAPLPASLPATFHAIVCVDYRDPDLWPRLRARLRPGGHLLVSMATERNLERHAKPSRRFLATPADVPRLLDGLTPIVASVDWRPGGRNELWVWARRPA